MRFLLAAITFVSLIFFRPTTTPTIPDLTAADPGPFESCACAADDGSCSVSGSCPLGCLAYCPSNRCRVTCVGKESGSLFDAESLITLRVKNASSQKVAAELARLTGAEVTISPRRANTTFNLDVKDEPLWNVLDTLSSGGSIQIAHEDFDHLRSVRLAFLSGERMAVCFHNVTARRLASDLSFLTGRDVFVAAGDANALVDYKGRGVNFEEMVAEISQVAGVELVIE